MKRNRVLLLLLCGYLGVYQGYLALYTSGQTQPQQVFPRRVSYYTEADQKALKEGIPFHTEAERNRLLEDYLS